MTNRFWRLTIGAVATIAVLGAATYTPALLANPSGIDPETAIREALQPYLAGHATGRGDVMAPVFATGARLTAVRDGKLHVVDAADYFASFPGHPAADEGERRRWIQSIDVTGDMALAKVVLLYPGVRFVDYIVMHRVDGEWTAVHKAYHAELR